tara:strand:- start:21 stop:155 length:135 start_codon:yes stop_codon:yes gene_type:complete
MKLLFAFLLGCRPGESLVEREKPVEDAPIDISDFDSGNIEDTAG